MLSLRGAVIALVASASIVLVLAGVSVGVFTAPSQETQRVGAPETGRPPAVVIPVPGPEASDVQALPPAQTAPPIDAPPVQVPPVVPADPPAVAPQSVPVDTPVVAAPAPVYREHAAQPVRYRPPAPRQPNPPEIHRPEPPSIERPEPISEPPASTVPAAHTKSRTVNTEPCNCSGHMRRVPTHWDPPQD